MIESFYGRVDDKSAFVSTSQVALYVFLSIFLSTASIASAILLVMTILTRFYRLESEIGRQYINQLNVIVKFIVIGMSGAGYSNTLPSTGFLAYIIVRLIYSVGTIAIAYFRLDDLVYYQVERANLIVGLVYLLILLQSIFGVRFLFDFWLVCRTTDVKNGKR